MFEVERHTTYMPSPRIRIGERNIKTILYSPLAYTVTVAILMMLLTLMLMLMYPGSGIRRRERTGAVERYVDTQPSSSSVDAWAEARVGYDDEAPRPLLDLALRRIAASRGANSRAASPSTVKVRAAWRERLPIDVKADSNGRDRWHRWSAVACFYRTGEPYGSCDLMDVRARTSWASGTPPTEWPMEVVSVKPEGGPPVPTSGLM